MDLIILSPHLDDGVFSCGGTIARETDAGRRVRVVTFYTGDPDPACVRPSMAKFCDYTQRQAEDQAATATLGAEHEWRRFVERAFRPPLLRGLSGVFRSPGTPESFINLEAICLELEGYLARYPDARLLAPLGVGNHFDHVELALAALLVTWRAKAFDRVAFYEDAYALGTRVRARHPVTRARMWKGREAPDRVSLRARGMFNLLAWFSRGPSAMELLPAEAPDLTWRCEAVPGIDVERKLTAVNLYASQVAMLGGPEGWGASLRRYHRYWQGAEPLWVASPRRPPCG